MNGNKTTRTVHPDTSDDRRTVRITLPPHVQERMRKLYGEPGSDASTDMSHAGCFRTLAGWIGRQIGR